MKPRRRGTGLAGVRRNSGAEVLFQIVKLWRPSVVASYQLGLLSRQVVNCVLLVSKETRKHGTPAAVRTAPWIQVEMPENTMRIAARQLQHLVQASSTYRFSQLGECRSGIQREKQGDVEFAEQVPAGNTHG